MQAFVGDLGELNTAISNLLVPSIVKHNKSCLPYLSWAVNYTTVVASNVVNKTRTTHLGARAVCLDLYQQTASSGTGLLFPVSRT